MTPQELDRLKEFTAFLSGTFKGSSFGTIDVDEMTILLVRLIEEQEEEVGGFHISEVFSKAMLEEIARPRVARLRSRILYHLTFGRYGRLRTYPVVRTMPKETQK